MRLMLAAIGVVLANGAAAQLPSGVAGPPTDPGNVRVHTEARPTPGPYRDAADLRETASDARRAGQITRRQERRTKREAGQLETLADRYAAGGLSDAEARELEVRGYVMRDQLSAARNRADPPARH